MLVLRPPRQIHHKPHRLQSVTRIDQSTFKGIGEFPFQGYILQDETRFRLVKHIHNGIQSFGNNSLHECLIKQMLDLKDEIAKYHRQSKTLERSCSWEGLGVIPFWVCPPSYDILKGLHGDFPVRLAIGCLVQLS